MGKVCPVPMKPLRNRDNVSIQNFFFTCSAGRKKSRISIDIFDTIL